MSLQLAVEYLEERAINSDQKCNTFLLRMCQKVLPLSEVKAVLEMVQKGTFEDFYNEHKERFP